MNTKMSLIALLLCILAALAGILYHLSTGIKDNVKVTSSIQIPQKKVEQPAEAPLPPLMEDLSGMDDYTIAQRYLNRLDGYVRTKNWRYALQQDTNFSMAMGRLTPEQRFQIKIRLVDILKPVFREADPNLGNRLCVYACMQPSSSPYPLILSNRIADIAEILINRAALSGSEAIYFYDHSMDYYLRTAKVFMREYPSETPEKIKTQARIAYLEQRLKTLKQNPHPSLPHQGKAPTLYKELYHWPKGNNK